MKKDAEEFMNGQTPKEIMECIVDIVFLMVADAFKDGYLTGHKDGMEEAVTTITE